MGIVKSLASRILIPLTKWYLQKERRVTIEGITISVLPGVFHPGLFSSTRFVIEHLKTMDLRDKRVLELGCGTGFISLFCSTKGATVLASDVSKKAIQNASLNFESNKRDINLIHSDLFDSIPAQKFDLIIINPPYYKAPARSEEELAWNCGADFEYFRKLFHQLHDYTRASGDVIMVLTKGCDLKSIDEIAAKNAFQMFVIREKRVLFDEKDFIFRIASTKLSHSEL